MTVREFFKKVNSKGGQLFSWGEAQFKAPTWVGMFLRISFPIWIVLLVILAFIICIFGLIGFISAKVMNGLYWLRYGRSDGKFDYLNFSKI